MQFSTHVSTNPLDILLRHLNRAPLAVDAILRVDHKLLVDIFINAGGAEARLRTRVHRQAHAFGNVGDVRLDPKVGRLIVLVVRTGTLQIREQVER